MVLGLLILSEALTLLATNADGLPAGELKGAVIKTRPSPSAQAHQDIQGVRGIQVAGADFYYRLDEKARFIELKNQWQSDHRGELPMQQAQAFSEKAYAQSSVEEVLKVWRYHGGPSPWVFCAKARLFNEGAVAFLNVPAHISYRAKVGELRVNSATQLTDFKHLQQSAKWQDMPGSHRTNIAVMAPGEDILLDLGPVHLLSFLGAHPNRWPTEIEVTVSSPRFATVRHRLQLTPDHFLTPSVY